MMRLLLSGYRQGGMSVVWGLTAFLLCCGASHAAQATPLVDYLYVEANEGDSSGGHAALRFGNETFHFQHETPGILRIRRFESAAFDHAYGKLGNRAIRESRIAVSEDTYVLLRNAFTRLFLIQDAQLEYRKALHGDVALFELLLRRSRAGRDEEISFPLKGLGYFLRDAHPSGAPQADTETGKSAAHSPALLSLLSRVRATHGEQFPAQRLAVARATLREIEQRAADASVAPLSPDTFPSFPTPASVRYEDALLSLFALEVLQAAPPLRPGTFRTSEDAAFKLDPTEMRALEDYAERLTSDLVALANSSRTDWGLPFIVGMARLAAIEASLASGRLVFLDIFPGEDQLPPHVDAALRPYLPAMTGEKRVVFLQRRRDFFTGRMREADYAALERAGNLLLELDRATAWGTPLRKDTEVPFPSREARLNVPVPDHPEAVRLEQELAAARTAERDYSAALDRIYSYDLVRRNCVTEIFSVINRAIEQHALARRDGTDAPAVAVRKESAERLGGFIDPSRGLTFIPFVSAREVIASYGVIDSRERPSYRTEQLAQMNRRESPLKVFLRESNTLTSTVYRPGPDDSKFLFFTDDTLLLRPLFGVFNLLAGLGESLFGIATLPAKGPHHFLAGTKGLLFSLPELVFVNLRKGSMAYVEQTPAAPNPAVSPAYSASNSRCGE